MVLKIRFLQDCVLINDFILVIGDMHIGYEENILEQGVVPRTQLKEILKKLDNVFNLINNEDIKIKKIVLLGDLKHEFGKISISEWGETLELLDYLVKKCKKIVLIKGNHDNMLSPIAEKRKIKLKSYYKVKIKNKEICFLHGDKYYKKCIENSDVLILGHLHPAISLTDKYKKEKYKCFLKGLLNRKKVYILPSFSKINLGYDIKEIKDLSKKNLDKGKDFFIINNKKLKDFEVIICNNKENKAYNFGKLKKFLK